MGTMVYREPNLPNRPRFSWKLRNRRLELGCQTLVMGILNVTPDSFSDGGRYSDPARAVEHASQILEEGADILDIGGESTRPGTHVAGDTAGSGATLPVDADEELRRVLPVLEAVRREHPHAIISIDTYKARVAEETIAAGADIINDVSAFQWDRAMGKVCARLECGVVLMHTRGRPSEWKSLAPEPDITGRVLHDLANRLQEAFEAGVDRGRIVLDPGYGFGKSFDEDYALISNLQQFQRLGFPILVGASRKRFVARAIAARLHRDIPASERIYGSLAAMVACILNGAHIVRVHDVRAAVEAAAVADEVLAATAARA